MSLTPEQALATLPYGGHTGTPPLLDRCKSRRHSSATPRSPRESISKPKLLHLKPGVISSTHGTQILGIQGFL